MKNVRRKWGMTLLATVLNYLTAIVATQLGMPFFLDTWGTSFVVLRDSLLTGIAAAILYNAAMALTYWGMGGLVWALSSIAVACMTWYFARKGWVNIERPLRLLAAGVCTGVVNGFIVFGILLVTNLPDIPLLAQANVLSRALLSGINNEMGAVLIEHITIEVMDKTISLIIAAVVLFVITEVIQKRGRAQRRAR